MATNIPTAATATKPPTTDELLASILAELQAIHLHLQEAAWAAIQSLPGQPHG